MAKKRISLDLDLDNPWDKKLWDYLDKQGIKSKTIRRILYDYLEGEDLPSINLNKDVNLKQYDSSSNDIKFKELKDDDIDDL